MPPKSKNCKHTASNINETTSKQPWNIKQAQPEEPEVIQENPEDQPGTSGRQRRGQGKRGGERAKGVAVNRKGKSARQDCLATTSALTDFNRITSTQKEAAVAKLKKGEGSDPSLKVYVSSCPFQKKKKIYYHYYFRAEQKFINSGVGIALPECFHSTTVATSGTVIPPHLTHQRRSNFKATQPAHTRSKDDKDDKDDEEDEEDEENEDDEEDDKECQDDEEDKHKTNSGQINEIQATVSIHGPTATHETTSC